MNSLKIAFANIYQGLIYEGKIGQKDTFSKYWPQAYAEQYAALNPDVVCLAEAPMDNAHGDSEFIANFAKLLGAVDVKTDIHDKSWLLAGKYYGNVILSKYPLKAYDTVKLPHPHLEVDRPDGSHWVLHDKTVQSAQLKLANTTINIFNLHYFPYFLFGRNMNEPEFAASRASFIDQLALDKHIPTILAGDFNNGDDHLEVAYPELFENKTLTDAVIFDEGQFDQRYVGGQYQLDHILYSTNAFSLISSQVIQDPSDHRGLLAELTLNEP